MFITGKEGQPSQALMGGISVFVAKVMAISSADENGGPACNR